MFIELPSEERELMIGMVQSRLKQLVPEISHSVDREYRAYLKHERELLENLLRRLCETPR